MKILLDEQMPHQLRPHLVGHDVITVKYKGWDGLSNGVLLNTAAANDVDVLLSCDQGLADQHDVRRLPCSIIIVHTGATNAIEDILPFVPAILDVLESMTPRTLTHVPPR